jgi:hypothetical protein
MQGGDIDQSEVHRNARRNLDYWFNPSIAHQYHRSLDALFNGLTGFRELAGNSRK